MLQEQLQKKLHNEIPLTKVMDIRIDTYNKNELITKAPLAININDKGTAFGGSLNTMTIISAWSMCWLISQELGFDSKNIVIIENKSSFKAPVTKNIICNTQRPSDDEIKIVKEKLEKKGSASIKIFSKILEENKVCLDFEGYYVIKI